MLGDLVVTTHCADRAPCPCTAAGLRRRSDRSADHWVKGADGQRGQDRPFDGHGLGERSGREELLIAHPDRQAFRLIRQIRDELFGGSVRTSFTTVATSTGRYMAGIAGYLVPILRSLPG